MKKVWSVLQRNYWWWTLRGIPFRYRVTYNVHQLISFINHVITKEKRISYFGKDFFYDHPLSPLILQTYPYEIIVKIKNNLEDEVHSVLDIGGNIGQFSTTLHALMEDVEVDIFEPNSIVYKTLKKNVDLREGLTAYNYGVGDKGVKKMYYKENHTGTGSVIKANANKGNKANLSSVNIKMVDDISTVTGKDTYDLIKIDVEGYEYDLLPYLKNITTQYLFIEVTGAAKEKDFISSEIFDRIKETFGDFEIVYHSEYMHENTVAELLLRFNK